MMGKRTIARVAILATAILATGALTATVRSGMPSRTAASEPAPCVATVLPDTYYQAIAELNACTGRGVAVEISPADIPWAITGDSLPSAPSRRILDP